MPGDEHTTDTGAHSTNANHGANDEDDDGGGTGSTNNEMDKTHPVDDKDVVSHVFLPANCHVYVSLTLILISNLSIPNRERVSIDDH